MKRSSRPRKTVSNLPETVHQQLNSYALAAKASDVSALAFQISGTKILTYALAASAAGVGALASVPSAEAKIIYKHVDVKIGSYQLNPVGETVAPFGIYEVFSSFSTNAWAAVSFNPATSGAKFVRGGGSSWSVAALPRGAVIGSKARWGGNRGLVATYGAGTFKHHKGGFQFGCPAFVGFKFKITGKPHYGWARLTARVGQTQKGLKYVYALLTGYAYETIPGKGIIAGEKKGPDEIDSSLEQPNPAALSMPTPEPATLGALAMGAPGLSIWRRKESALEGN